MNDLSDHTTNDFLSDLHRIRRLLSDAMTDRERNQITGTESPSPRSSLPPRPVAAEARGTASSPKPVSGLARPPLFGSIVEPVLPFGGSIITPVEHKIVEEKIVHVANITEVDKAIKDNIANNVDIAADPDEDYEQTNSDILQVDTEICEDTPPANNISNDNNNGIVFYRPPLVQHPHETAWLERISLIMSVFGWFGVLAGLMLIIFSGGQKDALLFGIGVRGICFGLGMVVVRMIGVSMLSSVPQQYTAARS
ncbi:MAG: hypothetical protein LBU65_08105 [Planctomycetaceae bacterium]|jgi:hypothetical protein|nr:hypothetical protein [Planctomycetaceae bacterium]